ncbi:MAG: hypothetical protein ABJD07_10700 [Gemmatimonadaceae bacterium]
MRHSLSLSNPIIVTFALVVAAVRGAGAQLPAPVGLLSGSAIGFSVGKFVPAGARVGEGLTTVVLHVTRLEPKAVGLDVAVGMWPNGLSGGALVLGVDVGGAYNIGVPGATFLLKAGPSALVAVGMGGGAGAIGAHAGGGAILRVGPAIGIRADLVEHYYYGAGTGGDGGTGFGALSLSLGLTSLSRNH